MPRVGMAKVYRWFLDLGTNVISGELVLAAAIWTGEPVIVTKRGKPVVKVIPAGTENSDLLGIHGRPVER